MKQNKKHQILVQCWRFTFTFIFHCFKITRCIYIYIYKWIKDGGKTCPRPITSLSLRWSEAFITLILLSESLSWRFVLPVWVWHSSSWTRRAPTCETSREFRQRLSWVHFQHVLCTNNGFCTLFIHKLLGDVIHICWLIHFSAEQYHILAVLRTCWTLIKKLE